MILARIPPVHLMAERLWRVHTRMKDLKEWDALEEGTYDELWTAATIRMRRQWRATLTEESLPGRRVREAILPAFEDWLDRRHGNMGYYLTQIMSGHGTFAEYTHRIRKTMDKECRMCRAEVDSAEHTVTVCPRWEIWREELIRSIDGCSDSSEERERWRIRTTADVTIGRLIPLMLNEPIIWKAVVTFAIRVLTEKEVAEKEGKWAKYITSNAACQVGPDTEEEKEEGNIEKEIDRLMGEARGYAA